MARAPAASLPAALGNDGEVQGAYRLMNSRHIGFDVLFAVHAEATRQRAEEAGDVLVVHDTTMCSFPNLDPAEIGYLPTGKPGFPLHLSLVLEANPYRKPLGVIYAEALRRTQKPRSRNSTQAARRKRSGHETARQPERESKRWWRGIQASAVALAKCGRVVHIADREGDNYELMAGLLEAEQRFVIRVRVDRRGREPGQGHQWSTVKEIARGTEGMIERNVPLSRRRKASEPARLKTHPPRKMRLARLQFAATTVEIPRPPYLADPTAATLKLNLVHVIENNAPENEPAVEWLLYTTEPIETATHIEHVVDTYRTRWTIEEFNAALKTGCAYEQREFRSRDALLRMLALTLPVACEVLWLRGRARSSPDVPATDVLTPLQVRLLRHFCPRQMPALPTARDALLAVAALGGHLKRNGEPGWKVLQRGMVLLITHEAGWEAAADAASRGQEL
jgi:hypothetical protein